MFHISTSPVLIMYEISFFQYFRNITVCFAYFSGHLLPSLEDLSRFLQKIDGRHHTETAMLQHVTVFQLSLPPCLLPGFRGEKTRKVSWEASPLNLRHLYSSPWAASISHHSAGCYPNRLSESSAGILSEYRLDFLLS